MSFLHKPIDLDNILCIFFQKNVTNHVLEIPMIKSNDNDFVKRMLQIVILISTEARSWDSNDPMTMSQYWFR